MTVPFSIDLISDLNLSDTDMFDWTGKPTSLFCAIAGNISDDLIVVQRVLEHLDEVYRGVFYIDGSLEHVNIYNYDERILRIKEICDRLPNVMYLHNHAIIVNEVAIVGCNGWFGNKKDIFDLEDVHQVQQLKMDDVSYLSNTIKKLQNQPEIEKILLISNSMPSEYLAFKNASSHFEDEMNLAICLMFDIDQKIKTWIFGTNDIVVDIKIDRIHFMNNPRDINVPYWPKRIEI
jgi:predicted phosphohydrolase